MAVSPAPISVLAMNYRKTTVISTTVNESLSAQAGKTVKIRMQRADPAVLDDTRFYMLCL